MSKLQQKSKTQSSPLVIDQELYQLMMKDPLYGPRTQIGIEIGRIIVKGEPDAV